jgi:hypothetical protein
MASTYSSNLKIELMGTGDNSGTWGTITNTNLGTAMEQAIIGLGNPDYTSDANLTITISNSNAAQAARALVLNVTSVFGSLTATRELIVPTTQKQYIVQNNTAGGQSITVKTSAGTGITVTNGRKAHLYVDGTNVIQMFDFVDINGGTIDGTPVGSASASTGAFTTLNASGATTLDGTVALGNASGDLITVPGTVGSNLIFTDNLYDIGASGATRPRNLFLAGAATVAGNLSVGGTLTLTGGVNLNGNVTVGDSSADTLTINSTITSNLIFTDNTYDIGASGATRPRNLFIAGNATIGGAQTLTGALTVDSTTDSSSTTTGSIQTDGGVGIAKALYVGLDANIYGLTVGRGNSAVSNNSAFGVSALAANTTGTENVAIGSAALFLTTTGGLNVAVGASALRTNVSGANNTAVGHQVLYDSTSSNNTGMGTNTLRFNTSGANNTGLGFNALFNNTTASSNTAVGYQAGYTNQTGTINTFVGYQAGYSSNVAGTAGNTAVGYGAGYALTSGVYNCFFGVDGGIGGAGGSTTSGSNNSFFGGAAGFANTSGGTNVAVGVQALRSNTTASNNTAVGYQAGYSNTTGLLEAFGAGALRSNTTGNYNKAFGEAALYYNTTGVSNCAFGGSALRENTTASSNSAFGESTLRANQTGSNNTAFGAQALTSNTTASNNTAVGYQAGYSNTTADGSTFVGYQAGYSSTNTNTAFGRSALFSTTGILNTAVGWYAGNAITTGTKNVIIGSYGGNSGGLDIRTASNYIVLSDGDANVRGTFDSSGNFLVGTTSSIGNGGVVQIKGPGATLYIEINSSSGSQNVIDIANVSNTAYKPMRYWVNGYGTTEVGSITCTTSLTSYNTSSDYRLKENIAPMTGALAKVAQLKPVTYKWKTDGSDGQGFIAHELAEVIPDCVTGEKDAVDENGKPQYQAMDTSHLIATLVSAIQELKAELDAYKSTHP